MQQTSENIKKNNLLEELVSNLDKDSIVKVIEKDTTIHVLERNRLKRVIEGFINKDKRYSNLSNDNADYFFEALYPLYESNIDYIKTTEDFVKVVENVNGKVDPVKVNDRMVHAFNENYRGFTKNYPLFNYNDAATFAIHEGTPYSEFVNILHDVYEENVDKEPFSFGSYRKNLDEKLSSKEINDKLEELFKSDSWTNLAWQYFYNKFKKFDDSMRDEIVDFVAKNPSHPKVKTVLGEEFNNGIKEDMTEDEQKEYLSEIEDIINNGESEGGSEEENTDEGANGLLGSEYDWEQFAEQMNNGEDINSDDTRKNTYVEENVWNDMVKNQDKYKKAYPKVEIKN